MHFSSSILLGDDEERVLARIFLRVFLTARISGTRRTSAIAGILQDSNRFAVAAATSCKFDSGPARSKAGAEVSSERNCYHVDLAKRACMPPTSNLEMREIDVSGQL